MKRSKTYHNYRSSILTTSRLTTCSVHKVGARWKILCSRKIIIYKQSFPFWLPCSCFFFLLKKFGSYHQGTLWVGKIDTSFANFLACKHQETSKIVERVTITINGWNFPLWTDDEYFFKHLLVKTMLFIFIEQILEWAWPSLFRITLTLLMSVSFDAQIFFSLSREYIAKAVSDSRYVR